MLITIITAAYNVSETIQDLIDSIRSQSNSNLQWIVIDGDSTDQTTEILQNNEDIIDYWISEPDKGIYDAWNKGIKKAKGDWILFLGADDKLIDSEVIEKITSILSEIPTDKMWAYGKIRYVSNSGRSQISGEPWYKVKKSFMSVMSVPHQGVLHRRELFERVGFFNESYKIAADYALLLKSVEKGYDPVFIPHIITEMAGSGVSNQPNLSPTVLNEYRRARKELNLREFTITWCFIYLKALTKSKIFELLGEEFYLRIVNTYRVLTGRPKL